MGLFSPALTKWALPFALFGAVYGIFRVMDDNASTEVRTLLTEFLKTRRYEPYLNRLPDIISALFTRVFGTRHFGIRCIYMSAIFSIVSVSLTLLFSVIYTYPHVMLVINTVKKLGDLLALALSPSQPDLAKFIRFWQTHAIWILPLLWISWCVVPDFLALGKIRIMLVVMKHTNPKITSLIITVITDLFIGIWIFITSVIIFQEVLIIVYLWETGSWSQLPTNLAITDMFSALRVAIVGSGMLFAVETSMLLGGKIFFGFPVANIFWASMLPSMWLWLYIGAAILTRLLVSGKPTFQRLIYSLDIDGHPVRSVGVVAASVIAVGCAVVVAAVSII
jgi:hypothetical protein